MRMLFNMAAPPSWPFETKMAAPGAMYNYKQWKQQSKKRLWIIGKFFFSKYA